MAELSEHEVVEWMKERRSNCLRIAAGKRGDDKAGWEEDACYFRAAVMMILGITDQAQLAAKDAVIAELRKALDVAKAGWDSAIADLRIAAEICREVEAPKEER